jgi:predicted ArsR family transcriptional regulator
MAIRRGRMAALWDQRFFRSTRGRIVTLLRRSGRTVEGLARELGLTDSGVRAHLATLERDGVVRQRGFVRRGSGGGKPAYVYELTPEAEELYPKGYEPVLRQLLDVLSGRLGPEESEAVLRIVGRRQAEELGVPVDGVRSRLEAAIGALNELGGLAELEESDGGFAICGYSCPLTSVVRDHPEACRLAEALLTELTGLPINEHCDRDESTCRCSFEAANPQAAEGE